MKLGIIGAGECFTEKALPALRATGDFRIEWIVDVLSEQEIRGKLEKIELDSFEYHKTDGFLPRIPERIVEAVMDFSPNRYHSHNIVLALNAGKHVYTEKPFAIDERGINQVGRVLSASRDLLVYFADYYRDEKGLPLRVLAGDLKPNDWRAQLITGFDESLLQALESIGNVKYVRGTCFEGRGKKSGIDHRLWLGDLDQGGMIFDLGTHLFSFLPILKQKIGNVSIEDCVVGICREAQEEYKRKTGNDMAETYAEVKLKSDKGALIEVAFGKYTGVDERVFYIEGEKGVVIMNFENQSMYVDSPAYRGTATIKSEPKYGIIMKNFARLLKDNNLHAPYQFDNSKETLQTILGAKRCADEKKVLLYDSGAVAGIERFLMQRNQ